MRTQTARIGRVLVLLAAGALLAGCGREETPRADTPSGLPVPRWISTRAAPVSMRAGPGFDYEILWQYRASGVPVQVVAETRDWRKVCGPDGAVAWIHRTRTAGRRTAMRTARTELPLLAAPEAGAAVRARLAGRAIAEVETCENGWCRLSVGDIGGWAPAGEVFGTAETAHCRHDDRARRGGPPAG